MKELSILLGALVSAVTLTGAIYAAGFLPVVSFQFEPVRMRVECIDCIQVCEQTCKRNGVPVERCDCSGCDPKCGSG